MSETTNLKYRLRTIIFIASTAAAVATLYWVGPNLGLRLRCQQVRTGFDIGSGTTKMTVARIDTCEKKILAVLEEAQEKVAYQESILADPESKIDTSTYEKGLAVLTKMAARSRDLGGVIMTGYATAAFRESSNGFEIADRLEKETGIQIQILSPQQEAEAGLAGVRILKGADTLQSHQLVIWDIGGGSQEILAGPDPSQLFRGTIASVGFKQRVIEKIKGRLPKKHVPSEKLRAKGKEGAEKPNSQAGPNSDPKFESPNPLDTKQVAAALKEAQEFAQAVPPGVRAVLKTPGAEVIGIGGVHWFSIRNQLGEVPQYSQADIERAIQERTGWTDEKFNSKYADTELTNLIFVLGFMRELGIEKVTPMKVNLSLGAMFEAIPRQE